MAFAVESYIFDWIFLTILQYLNLAVNTFKKNDNKMPRKVVYTTTDWLGVCDISSGVGVCVAYSNEWAAKV